MRKGAWGTLGKFLPNHSRPSSRRFVAVVLQPRWHRSVGSDKCMNPSLLLADDSSSGSEERGLWHYLPASTLRSYKKKSQNRSGCTLILRVSEDSKRISGVGFRLRSIERHTILLQRLVHGRARDPPHHPFFIWSSFRDAGPRFRLIGRSSMAIFAV